MSLPFPTPNIFLYNSSNNRNSTYSVNKNSSTGMGVVLIVGKTCIAHVRHKLNEALYSNTCKPITTPQGRCKLHFRDKKTEAQKG